MQILHPFRGSLQQYLEQLGDWESPRPSRCPQCVANRPLTAHGFYVRTLIHLGFDDEIRVRGICAKRAAAPFRCCRTWLCRTCAPVSP